MQAVGHRFDPDSLHQTTYSLAILHHDELACAFTRRELAGERISCFLGVAQLVARLLWEQDVGSSSLSTETIFFMRAWLAAHVFAVVAGKIGETTSRGAVPATPELAYEILFARVAE